MGTLSMYYIRKYRDSNLLLKVSSINKDKGYIYRRITTTIITIL